jgi:Holliday junction resolvase
MPNANYVAGRRLEYEVRDALEALGFHVTRSARSGGLVDLLACEPVGDTAFDHPTIYFIQCKRGGTLGPAAWDEFFDYARRYGAVPILAVRALREPLHFMRLDSWKGVGGRRQPWSEWHPAGEPEGEEDE